MRKREAIYLGFVALLCVVLAISGCAAPAPTLKQASQVQPGPLPSLGIHYVGAQGKVGHHLYAEPRANCPVTWNKDDFTHVSGNLPPGLNFRGSRIEGVPEVPGRWSVTVKFSGVRCQNRPFADQDVNVYFDIEGMAPRKVR